MNESEIAIAMLKDADTYTAHILSGLTPKEAWEKTMTEVR